MAAAPIQQSTAPKYPVDTPKAEYMKGAGEKFDSFYQQATESLDRYWPRWNDYENPRGYLIPPAFEFKHPEVSESALERWKEAKKAQSKDNIISDRQGDTAEYLPYAEIGKLINDPSVCPFVAINNMKISLKSGPLNRIFPLQTEKWNHFQQILGGTDAEYDFILIGPKFGFIIIEVKGALFINKKDFKHGDANLPNDYKKGLDQLKKFNAMAYLLEELARIAVTDSSPKRFGSILQIPANSVKVRRIICTPNLEKERYRQWMDSLSEQGKVSVEKRVNTVIQMFKGDESSIKELLMEDGNSIHKDLYEIYAPILASAVSATALCTYSAVDLDESKISETAVISKLHACFETQNPQAGLKSTKLSRAAQLVEANLNLPEPTKGHGVSKIYFLTPEQQQALKGPRRQLIIGVAGTGKTVVLQAKAIQLLSEGKSVLLIAMDSVKEKYEALFRSYSFTNYKIINLIELPASLRKICAIKTDPSTLRNILHNYTKDNAELPKSEEIILSYDNVIIDDGWDVVDYLHMFVLAEIYPEKLVWIGLDPVKSGDHHLYDSKNVGVIETLTGSTDKTIINLDNNSNAGFAITVFRHVMRCSKTIFDASYFLNQTLDPLFRPLIGHEIPGPIYINKQIHCETLREAVCSTFDTAKEYIRDFMRQGGSLQDIAVIVFDDAIYDHSMILQETWQGLTVKKWSEVSSLEWPYVLCLSMKEEWEKVKTETKLEYHHYRAMSRATSKLINVFISYPHILRGDKWSSNEITTLINVAEPFLRQTRGLANPESLDFWKSDIFLDFNRYDINYGRRANDIKKEFSNLIRKTRHCLKFLKFFEQRLRGKPTSISIILRRIKEAYKPTEHVFALINIFIEEMLKHNELSNVSLSDLEEADTLIAPPTTHIPSAIDRNTAEADFLILASLDNQKYHLTGPPDMHNKIIALCDLNLNWERKNELLQRCSSIFSPFLHQNLNPTTLNGKDLPVTSNYTENEKYDFIVFSHASVIVFRNDCSLFNLPTDFAPGNPAFPVTYEKSLVQLQSSQGIVYKILEEAIASDLFSEQNPSAGSNIEYFITSSFKRVLFTPNLERRMYDQWLQSLPETDRHIVTSKIGGVRQWFAEDTDRIVQRLAISTSSIETDRHIVTSKIAIGDVRQWFAEDTDRIVQRLAISISSTGIPDFYPEMYEKIFYEIALAAAFSYNFVI